MDLEFEIAVDRNAKRPAGCPTLHVARHLDSGCGKQCSEKPRPHPQPFSKREKGVLNPLPPGEGRVRARIAAPLEVTTN